MPEPRLDPASPGADVALGTSPSGVGRPGSDWLWATLDAKTWDAPIAARHMLSWSATPARPTAPRAARCQTPVWATAAETFKLSGLKASLPAGSHECY